MPVCTFGTSQFLVSFNMLMILSGKLSGSLPVSNMNTLSSQRCQQETRATECQLIDLQRRFCSCSCYFAYHPGQNNYSY